MPVLIGFKIEIVIVLLGIIIPDFHYGRDSLIGIALVLSHIARTGVPMSTLRNGYPHYEMAKNKIELRPGMNPDEIIESYDVRVFQDGSFFKTDRIATNGKLLFQIIEENVPQGNDNFEIEIFEIEDVDGNSAIKNTTKTTELKQLRLLVEPELIINDILIDEADGNSLSPSDVDSSFADYFFDILTDDEIDEIIHEVDLDGDGQLNIDGE